MWEEVKEVVGGVFIGFILCAWCGVLFGRDKYFSPKTTEQIVSLIHHGVPLQVDTEGRIWLWNPTLRCSTMVTKEELKGICERTFQTPK